MRQSAIRSLLFSIPFATVIVLGTSMAWAPGVFAAQDAIFCPADRINSNGNVCTAADVKVAAAIVGDESAFPECMAGDSFSVDIDAQVELRKGERYDIGIWIASDGLPIDLRSGATLPPPYDFTTPAEGGASSCEVVSLQFPAIHRPFKMVT
jgi:hypothetical protein